ncbi:MAG: hypothetical protein GOV00_03205 [Candidatus Altiarchaeota archaeon]|nr:hypothetical protein [Candidatus Altiarchaeota archaeon]
MQDKKVGFLIIAVTVLIGLIVWMFNQALAEIVSVSCSHGPDCPMWGTIKAQTNVGRIVMVLLLVIGAYLIFIGDRRENGGTSKPNYERLIKDLRVDERVVFRPIADAEGTLFQSEIVEKTGFTKVKVSRILDRLEGKGILERRRRGMSNVVIIKNGHRP